MFNVKLSTQFHEFKNTMKNQIISKMLLAAFISLGFAGCSSTADDKSENWSPNKIYSEAKSEANDGAYDKARKANNEDDRRTPSPGDTAKCGGPISSDCSTS